IARQGVALDWAVLARKSDQDLVDAIAESGREKIIRIVPDEEVTAFLRVLRSLATERVLRSGTDDGGSPKLLESLPNQKARTGFLNAARSFTGSDYSEFWKSHLPTQPEF